MAKVIFGNHSSVIVPMKERDNIRKFYCDVLGGKITRVDEARDFLCLGNTFYIAFLYTDVADESAFQRTARSIWLEIKSDDVVETKQKILDFGVLQLDIPDPHLYFQAPGGQVLRLVDIDEDLSFYEGTGTGPDVAKVKEAVGKVKSQSYSAAIEVSISPGEIFSHLTNDVSRWWSKDFAGKSAALNDEFIIEHPGRHFSKQQIIELIPDQKVVWLVTESHLNWLEKDKDEWTNTKMVFEINSKGDTTLLKFTHEGLIPELECFTRCSQGWDMVIKDWLYKLLFGSDR